MGSKRIDWLGVAFFGTLSSVTFGLGTWQTQRYQWKVNAVAERKHKLESPPVALKESSRMAYERVTCTGKFEVANSMLIGPRTPPASAPASAAAMAPSGFYVVTPFELEGSGEKILVNRGWIPRNRRDLAFAEDTGDSSIDPVTFEGVIGVGETAGAFTPKKGEGEQVDFFALDPKELSRAKNLPFEALLVDRINGQGPIVSKTLQSMQTFKVDPSTHIGYAATWYGLSATGLYMIKRRFFR